MKKTIINGNDVAMLIHSASPSERSAMILCFTKGGLSTMGIYANELIKEAIFNTGQIDMQKLKIGIDAAANEIAVLKQRIEKSIPKGKSANLAKIELNQISY
jgi:hypothetical protein